jgi:hypothetical protein
MLFIVYHLFYLTEYCKRIDEGLIREFGDPMQSFNKVKEVLDDIDTANHPLRLHRLTVNR